MSSDMILDVFGLDEAAAEGAAGGVAAAGGVRLYSGAPISDMGRDKVERGLGGAGGEGCISVRRPPRPGCCWRMVPNDETGGAAATTLGGSGGRVEGIASLGARWLG